MLKVEPKSAEPAKKDDKGCGCQKPKFLFKTTPAQHAQRVRALRESIQKRSGHLNKKLFT